MHARWGLALTLLAATPAAAQEEDAPARDLWAELGGRVSLRAGAWTHDRQLGSETVTAVGSIRGEIAPRLSDAVDLRFAGWAQADSARGGRADLIQGYARARFGPVELLAGREIVVWGRADRLNPTDVLSSRDYTLLVADDDEQRRGSAMARLRLGLDALTLDGYWLPEFRPNRFPLERRRPGVQILPDQEVDAQDQFAVKLDRSGGRVDWSIGWFQGRDRTRDLTPAAPTAAAPPGTRLAIQETYPKVRVLGADFATVAGSFGLRGEIAWSDYRGPNTVFRKQDNIWAVLGADTTLAGGWNLNLQYSFRAILGFDPVRGPNPLLEAVARRSAAVNNRLDRYQHGATFRVARAFFQDTLEAELASVVFFERMNAAIRPKLSYAVDDRVRATLGADIFLGPRLSYFGQVQRLSALYLQLSYSR